MWSCPCIIETAWRGHVMAVWPINRFLFMSTMFPNSSRIVFGGKLGMDHFKFRWLLFRLGVADVPCEHQDQTNAYLQEDVRKQSILQTTHSGLCWWTYIQQCLRGKLNVFLVATGDNRLLMFTWNLLMSTKCYMITCVSLMTISENTCIFK
jgi:hypothetical protein